MKLAVKRVILVNCKFEKMLVLQLQRWFNGKEKGITLRFFSPATATHRHFFNYELKITNYE